MAVSLPHQRSDASRHDGLQVHGQECWHNLLKCMADAPKQLQVDPLMSGLQGDAVGQDALTMNQ
eukprot:1156347-Pelagomonas_calceolata.AAC.10